MHHMCQGTTNTKKATYAFIPSRPWERVATDPYDLKGRKCINLVDYYSRWFEIKELCDETSHAVIKALKEVFATRRIPDVVMSDN